jgi:ParB family chromosome partitioning protein
MYSRAISSGLFTSNKKLADSIGVDLGLVGKAISLATLPVDVFLMLTSEGG